MYAFNIPDQCKEKDELPNTDSLKPCPDQWLQTDLLVAVMVSFIVTSTEV